MEELTQSQHPGMLPCLKILSRGGLVCKRSSFTIAIPIIETGKISMNLPCEHIRPIHSTCFDFILTSCSWSSGVPHLGKASAVKPLTLPAVLERFCHQKYSRSTDSILIHLFINLLSQKSRCCKHKCPFKCLMVFQAALGAMSGPALQIIFFAIEYVQGTSGNWNGGIPPTHLLPAAKRWVCASKGKEKVSPSNCCIE